MPIFVKVFITIAIQAYRNNCVARLTHAVGISVQSDMEINRKNIKTKNEKREERKSRLNGQLIHKVIPSSKIISNFEVQNC